MLFIPVLCMQLKIMKRIVPNITFILVLLTLMACGGSERNVKKGSVEVKEAPDTNVNEVESLLKESENYLKNRDFDGDKISDHMSFSYSGGAHCCYKMGLKLSTKKDTIKYPFEMDGGYGFGIVDGSRHDQFNIDDYDQDGLAEIFMGISTYNGEKYPIDKKWTDEYGIKTNYIIFDFHEGEVVLSDYDMKKHTTKPKLHP